MGPLRQAIADWVWPIRPGAPNAAEGALLKQLIVVALILLCGPDFFAFVELSTLLDLLGATLFLLSFAAGGRLLLAQLGALIHKTLLPPGYVTIIRAKNLPSFRVYGGQPFLINIAWWCTLLLLPWALLRAFR